MARVTRVERARKSPGRCGKCDDTIKVGSPYLWWKFRFGGKRVRCAKPKCRPRASDLTQSAFYGGLYDAQDRIEAAATACRDGGDIHDLAEELRSIAEDVRELGEEARGNFDNMPEGLQQGDTGQLLETRADECESKAGELEQAADTIDGIADGDADEEGDTGEDRRENAASEAEGVDLSID